MRFLVRASAGLWLWALGFSLLYGLHGIGCAREWNRLPLLGGTVFGWSMIALWLILVATAAAMIMWARHSPEGLERRLTLCSTVVGFVSIVVTGAPVIATTACL
ncbi:hypothetical protein K9B35_04750 [Sphingomonas sp. R647]|uniref:hypothetical protein n=1 Tax=Sphingomonas sp. R647 TaxID=2875233 RepID=UPI001CD1CFF3|nr:hypothetical protein [Sphingomonas sp. R647]MCA1197266.1 hypothetical protein [Sphingomonas sp. R647]